MAVKRTAWRVAAEARRAELTNNSATPITKVALAAASSSRISAGMSQRPLRVCSRRRVRRRSSSSETLAEDPRSAAMASVGEPLKNVRMTCTRTEAPALVLGMVGE